MFIGVQAKLACQDIDREYRELCAQYSEHIMAEIGYIARWLSMSRGAHASELTDNDTRDAVYAARTLAGLAETYGLSPDGVQRLLFIAEPSLMEQ